MSWSLIQTDLPVGKLCTAVFTVRFAVLCLFNLLELQKWRLFNKPWKLWKPFWHLNVPLRFSLTCFPKQTSALRTHQPHFSSVADRSFLRSKVLIYTSLWLINHNLLSGLYMGGCLVLSWVTKVLYVGNAWAYKTTDINVKASFQGKKARQRVRKLWEERLFLVPTHQWRLDLSHFQFEPRWGSSKLQP